MITTADFYILGKPLHSDQGLKHRPRVTTVQPSFAASKVEMEADTRLWKVCAKAASPQLSGFEWVAILLLGASALGAIVYGFSELFHLFNSGALDQAVCALLTA